MSIPRSFDIIGDKEKAVAIIENRKEHPYTKTELKKITVSVYKKDKLLVVLKSLKGRH